MRLLSEGDPIQRRLFQAALELLAERGYRGATTREIARRAGVSEVTLFRRFGSKKRLLQEALLSFTPEAFLAALPREDDPLEAGLSRLFRAYQGLLEAHRALFPKLLAELLRHPELLPEGPPQGMALALKAILGFFQAQQEKGLLRRDEPPEELALAFIGPLFARFLLGEAFGVRLPVEEAAYIRGYLEGRHDPSGRRGS